MAYLSHYNWNTCEVVRVDNPPAEYEYMLKYEPLHSEYDNSICGGLVTIIDYAKGIRISEYIPQEELHYFEPANVAADLCHRLDFCMERPARYDFACVESPHIMFISKKITPEELEYMEWHDES